MPLYKVEDMSCAHCVAAIEKSVKALDADAGVTCDLATRIVDIQSHADPAVIRAALDEVGYGAVPV